MNPLDKVAAQAVANAMSGSKDYYEVNFPASGDNQTDLVSGVLCIVNSLNISPPQAAEVMAFLQKRFERETQAMEASSRQYMREKMQELTRQWSSMYPGTAANPAQNQPQISSNSKGRVVADELAPSNWEQLKKLFG